MSDPDCVAFLQWALPRLGRRWAGYRKVRRQVCRRVRRRARALGLNTYAQYRAYLEREPDEWAALEALTNVTISRFYRDHGVWEFIARELLPGGGALRAWSAGCASGEEPYTLALAAAQAGTRIEILATDVDPALLRRARAARYPESALRELPADWRAAAFDAARVLDTRFRRPVTFAEHDVRDEPPGGGPFDLILCRYLAFTYLDEPLQRTVLARFAAAARPGAALVIGTHEELPNHETFAPWAPQHGVYRARRP